MKKIFGFLSVVLVACTLSACGGSDDPDSKHNVRDFDVVCLTHATDIATGEVEAVATRYQAFRIDFTDNIGTFQLLHGVNRAGATSLLCENVPLTKSEGGNEYTVNVNTTTSNYVTNLKSDISFTDYTVKFDYILSGTWHVIAVMPSLTYLTSQTQVDDYSPTGVVYNLYINPETKLASVRFSNIQLASDQRGWQHILTTEATPANVDFTTTGFRLTGTNLNTEAYRVGSTVDDANKVTSLIIKAIDINVNIVDDTMTLTATLNSGDRDYNITSSASIK